MRLTTEQKSFYKGAFALVIPLAIQNLINVGVQSADVVMLGMVGENVLSASSLAGQVQFVMMLIFFGLSSGATVLTAQYWGKGNVRAIEKVLSIALRFSAGTALLFFVAAMAIPELLMRIFTADAAIIELGIGYLRIIAPSYLCISFTVIYLNIIRSVERVIISTVVFSISLVTNVSLNAIFIFGLLGVPAMGINGAALATTIARVIEVIIVAIYAARNTTVRLRVKDFFSTHGVLMRDFFRYSGPTILNEMMWGLAIATNSMIIGRLGAAAVAANSVAQVTRQLATVVGFGVANAAAIIIGKAIGANDARLAETSARRMLVASIVTGLAGATLIFFARPAIISFMSLSAEAKHYLELLLFIMCLFVIAQSFNAVFIVGIFRGGGDTRFGLLLDVGSLWFITLPLGALGAFVFHWPIEAVFWIIMSDEFIKLPFAYLRYRSGRWLRNVTRDNLS